MFIVSYTYIAATDNINNNINDSSETNVNEIINARVHTSSIRPTTAFVRACDYRAWQTCPERLEDFFYSLTKFRQNLLSARLRSGLQTPRPVELIHQGAAALLPHHRCYWLYNWNRSTLYVTIIFSSSILQEPKWRRNQAALSWRIGMILYFVSF